METANDYFAQSLVGRVIHADRGLTTPVLELLLELGRSGEQNGLRKPLMLSYHAS
jgi:hypothetical protein